MKNPYRGFLTTFVQLFVVVGLWTSAAKGDQPWPFPTTAIKPKLWNLIRVPQGQKLAGKSYVIASYGAVDPAHPNGAVRISADGTEASGRYQGTGFSENVTATLAVPDGSGDVYYAGPFEYYDWQPGTASIVRLHPDGKVDSRFNPKLGFTDWGAGRPQIKRLISAADGSGAFYVIGSFTFYNDLPVSGIARLLPDGSIDPSFPSQKFFCHDNLAVEKDGTGAFYSSCGGSQLNRYLRDGTPDPGFTVGNLRAGQYSSPTINSITTVISGGAFVSGQFGTYNGVNRAMLIKIEKDGKIDPGFVSESSFDGTVTFTYPIASGPNGILVSGQFERYNEYDTGRSVLLNPHGLLDLSQTPIKFDGNLQAAWPALDGTADLFVYGLSSLADLWRVSGMDSSSVTLKKMFSFSDAVPLMPAPDGSKEFILGGQLQPKTQFNVANNTVLRLNQDGDVDHSFQVQTIGGGPEYLWPEITTIELADDGSGDLFIAGTFKRYGGAQVSGLIRIRDDGKLVRDMMPPIQDQYLRILTLASSGEGKGSLFVGGSFHEFQGSRSWSIVKLNADGSVDPSFDTRGFVDSTSGFVGGSPGQVSTIVPVGDGSGDLLVAGKWLVQYNDQDTGGIVRIDQTGQLVKKIGAFETNSGVGQLLVVPGGKYFFAVGANLPGAPKFTWSIVARYFIDGTYDDSFNPTPSLPSGSGVNGVFLASDDPGERDLYITLSQYEYSAITPFHVRALRMAWNGTPDPTAQISGTNCEIGALYPTEDGSGDLWITGAFNQYSGVMRPGIARLKKDGSLR